MDAFDLSSCTASVRTEPHCEYPTRLYHISGAVVHPTYGEIAFLTGYFLSVRYAWKRAGDFAEIMGDESEELDWFCHDVFDCNFNVHSWLIDGGRRSGSGCWGRELNSGDVVYLEEISVKSQFRRRGVGSKLLGELFSSPDIRPPFSLVGDPHLYCWPVGNAEQSQASVVAFFHNNGFRRVGLGNFLCYSFDPNYPSRFVAVTDDPEPPSPQYPNTVNLTLEELEHAYSLHSAISFKKGLEVVEIIKSAHAKDPGSIHKQGRHGYTPIHVAAEWLNIDAIRTLLELGVSEDLNNVENRSGATVLEIFTSTLQFRRRLFDDHGTWDGYSTEELKTEYALLRASNVPPCPLSEEEYISKRKLGCTCGQCTDGWLSPRMRHRLSISAIVEFDTSMLELGYMDRRPSAEEYLSNVWILEYIPAALHRGMNKGFVTDFISIFRTVYDILKTPGAIPDATCVSSNTSAFLFTGRGGKVEYAIDVIISFAKDQSPLGDNTFDDPHGEDNGRFPSCENDLEFGFVRRKLGLDPRSQWGPYV